jgi:hypothetical protein
VGLATQWERFSASLPDGWERAELRLRVPDVQELERATALLGPLMPGRVRGEIYFQVSRHAGVGPEASRRLLAHLDEEGIEGTLVLAGIVVPARAAPGATAAPAPASAPVPARAAPMATQWDMLASALPADWSDLLCRVDLASSDDLPRAALLAAPLNPSRPEGEVGFDFRAARTTGYGASAQMVRRCLARLDESGIPGRVEVLRALSDSRHVSTQGPVWYVGGKVL